MAYYELTYGPRAAKIASNRPKASTSAKKRRNPANAKLAKGEKIERKRVEEERWAAAVIDAMGDGLILVDMDGKITAVNPAFEKMTGYEKSELVGKDAADVVQKLVKSEDLENAMEGLKTASEGKIPVSGVLTFVSKDGREILTTFSLSAIKDTEGKPTTLIYNIKDITEFKKAEEERLKADKRRMEELEKFTKAAVGRELKMIELKRRIKELESKLKKITENR